MPVWVKVKSTVVLMWAKGEGQTWPGISSLMAAHLVLPRSLTWAGFQGTYLYTPKLEGRDCIKVHIHCSVIKGSVV